MNTSGINTMRMNEFAVTLDGETILSCDLFEYLTADGDGAKPLLTFYKQVRIARSMARPQRSFGR